MAKQDKKLEGNLISLDLKPTQKGQMAILMVREKAAQGDREIKALAFNDLAVDLTASLDAAQENDGSYRAGTRVSLSGYWKKNTYKGRETWQFMIKGFTPADPNFVSDSTPAEGVLPDYLTEVIPDDVYAELHQSEFYASEASIDGMPPNGPPPVDGYGAEIGRPENPANTLVMGAPVTGLPAKNQQNRHAKLLKSALDEGQDWREYAEDVQWLVFALVKRGIFASPAEAFAAWLLRCRTKKEVWKTPPESEVEVYQAIACYFSE